jgi:hypothetical protein
MSAQTLSRQERANPHYLPGERQLALVVHTRFSKRFPTDFQFCVVKEDLALTVVQPPTRGRFGHDPLDELPSDLADGLNALRALRPQPFAQSGFIGEGLDPGQALGYRVGLQPFCIG